MGRLQNMGIFLPITQVAVNAVLKAGEILAQGFGTHYTKTLKPGIQNYVTEFDHAAEKCLIEEIRAHYPSHAFLAEESGSLPTEGSEILWLIDPLDGTTNFAHNIPLFCISVAAFRGEEGVCGVIYQPMTRELFVAEKGKGAYLNQKRIKVSPTSPFAGGLGATGFPRNIHDNPLHCIDHYIKILTQGTIIRNLGSSALNLAYVAAGCFDAYWAISLHPWDIAAGLILIEEAGGTCSTYAGKTYPLLSGLPLLATNGLVHNELLHYLKDSKQN
jgi:myo-inositol-1(or 4)-monophosphatase